MKAAIGDVKLTMVYLCIVVVTIDNTNHWFKVENVKVDKL